ncbi:hypothetical protein KIN20_026943 [Parelaphostrongylus tenuis]|uniref:Uncharacterized protein n=1 Tax=Parelaphostrongylus tenuis TaxID=148309 RepID=A0AAD5QYR4_PARTN|nr:hypothetical protein KIN20_026943 [Parelaphostrongylus tenuis]
MMMQDKAPRRCIIARNTVTVFWIGGQQLGTCDMPAAMKATVTSVFDKFTSISGTLIVWTLCFLTQNPNIKKTSCVDHKHHHGELVESDVAKRNEQSDSNVGIGSIWKALLLGNWHCWRELKLARDMLDTDIFI